FSDHSIGVCWIVRQVPSDSGGDRGGVHLIPLALPSPADRPPTGPSGFMIKCTASWMSRISRGSRRRSLPTALNIPSMMTGSLSSAPPASLASRASSANGSARAIGLVGPPPTEDEELCSAGREARGGGGWRPGPIATPLILKRDPVGDNQDV